MKNIYFIIIGIVIMVAGTTIIFLTLDPKFSSEYNEISSQYFNKLDLDDCQRDYLFFEGKKISLNKFYAPITKDTGSSGIVECINNLNYEPVKVTLKETVMEPAPYFLKKLSVEGKFQRLPNFDDRITTFGFIICDPPTFNEKYHFRESIALWIIGDENNNLLAVWSGNEPYSLKFENFEIPNEFIGEKVSIEGILVPWPLESHGCSYQSAIFLLQQIENIKLVQ